MSWARSLNVFGLTKLHVSIIWVKKQTFFHHCVYHLYIRWMIFCLYISWINLPVIHYEKFISLCALQFFFFKDFFFFFFYSPLQTTGVQGKSGEKIDSTKWVNMLPGERMLHPLAVKVWQNRGWGGRGCGHMSGTLFPLTHIWSTWPLQWASVHQKEIVLNCWTKKRRKKWSVLSACADWLIAVCQANPHNMLILSLHPLHPDTSVVPSLPPHLTAPSVASRVL